MSHPLHTKNDRQHTQFCPLSNWALSLTGEWSQFRHSHCYHHFKKMSMIILPLTQRENGWHTEIAVSIHQQSFICPIQLKTECKIKFLVFLYTGDHNHEQNEPPPTKKSKRWKTKCHWPLIPNFAQDFLINPKNDRWRGQLWVDKR